MMAVKKMLAQEPSEIEVLLPWHAAGTLSARDAKRVEEALAGQTFGPKDMGAAMKAVQAKIQASGLRADGRQVSEIVKAKLAQ